MGGNMPAAWETQKLQTKRQAVRWLVGGESGVRKLVGVVVRCFKEHGS